MMCNPSQQFRFPLVVVALCISVHSLKAQKPLPKSQAILEIDAPPRSRIYVARQDKGAQTKFVYNNMPAGKYYRFEVKARFPSGGEATKWVMIRGGWRVEATLRPLRGSLPQLVPPSGHSGKIHAICRSRDNKWIATASKDCVAILWDASTGRSLRRFSGHTDQILSVDISSDGKHLLTGAIDNTVGIWHIQSGRELHTLELGARVFAVAFSPDGRSALVRFTPKKVAGGKGMYEYARLYNVKTGHLIRSYSAKNPDYSHVAFFHPDGKRFVTGSIVEKHSLTLVNILTGSIEKGLLSRDHPVNTAAISQDGRRLFVGHNLSIFQPNIPLKCSLWDIPTGKKLQSFQGHKNSVISVRFSDDGRSVLSCSEESAIVWDVRTGKKIHSVTTNKDFFQFATFHSKGSRLFIGRYSGHLFGRDVPSGAETQFGSSSRPIRRISLNKNGKRMMISAAHRTWDLASPDSVFVFDTQSGKLEQTFNTRHNLFEVALSHDGKRALLGTGYNSVAELWDVESGKKIDGYIQRGKQTHTPHLAFTPDDKNICFGLGWLSLYSINPRKEHRVFKVSGDFAFNSDGQYILVGTETGAKIWNTQTGRQYRSLTTKMTKESYIEHVAYGPLGNVAAATTSDARIVLWDVPRGREYHTFKSENSEYINAFAFSPDQQYFLIATLHHIFVYETKSAKKIHKFSLPSTIVWDALFHPSGRHIYSGSEDGMLRLWDMATGDELFQMARLSEGKDWFIGTPSGLFDANAESRQKVSYRVGGGLNVVPVDRFFQDFYRPGLLQSIWKGERPTPVVALGKEIPPLVRILSPKAGYVDQPRATVQVEAVDQGGGVKGPYLMHNGARVLGSGRAERRGKMVKRTFVVDLVQGDNEITIKAASSDGSWESEPATVVLKYARPLAKAQLYVLAAGINKYADQTMNLRFAAQDARAIGGLFQRRGKALYEKVHLTTLTDGQATKNGIRRALTAIEKKAKAQDTLIVFLAGHGAMVYKRYYFIPADFRASKQRTSLEDIRRQGVPADAISDYMTGVPARKRIFILDTCNSGGALSTTRTSRNPFAFRGAIEKLSRSDGVFTIAASAAGDEAQEVKELGHGVLTYTLLAGLGAVQQGPLRDRAIRPSNRDRVAGVLEWFNFADGQVPNLTRRYFGREQSVEMQAQGRSFPVLPVED